MCCTNLTKLTSREWQNRTVKTILRRQQFFLSGLYPESVDALQLRVEYVQLHINILLLKLYSVGQVWFPVDTIYAMSSSIIVMRLTGKKLRGKYIIQFTTTTTSLRSMVLKEVARYILCTYDFAVLCLPEYISLNNYVIRGLSQR